MGAKPPSCPFIIKRSYGLTLLFMKNSEDLFKLFERILNGEATEEDIRKYNRWCHSFQGGTSSVPDISEIKTGMIAEIEKRIHHNSKPKQLRLWTKIAVAASVILALFFGSYYLLNRHQEKYIVRNQTDIVQPGTNKAVLTLANGQTIILNNAHTGQLASQGSSRVTKADSGLLVYQNEPKAKRQKLNASVEYNTLKIPRGGQYRLVLPDGTKVWLNAASSIRFPTAFTGKVRRVSVRGEVYMEVAKDVNKPFIVHAGHTNIKVLGTRFNVMAYDDQPAVATTLLQGSIKVGISGTKEATILTPGQQASVDKTGKSIKVKKVDATAVAAWIHGLLSMKDCGVREFMDKLSRWYDVDIEYEGKVPQKRFGGLINRNAPLSNVLSALEAAGIHTKLKKQKIIVFTNQT